MYKMLKAETLAAKIHLMVVHAPRVASHCQPGQFIIVKLDEKGERIPLTICDYDREEGTVTIVFQEIGVSTIKMAELKAGDAFRDFVGPLGCPSEFVEEDIEELKKKKMVFVARTFGSCSLTGTFFNIFASAITCHLHNVHIRHDGYHLPEVSVMHVPLQSYTSGFSS